jgi:hypothetical protein
MRTTDAFGDRFLLKTYSSMVEKWGPQNASMRLWRALYEAQFWGFSDMESMEYVNPGIEGQIFLWKDDLFGGRYWRRLPVSDPMGGSKRG